MRFPEFDEEWEEKTLGEISDISAGGTPNRANPLYWNGDIPWATTSLIDFNIIYDTEENITKQGLENSSAKIFPKDSILLAMYGQGKTRGKVAILGIEAATNQACASIKTNSNILNHIFLFQNLSKRYDEIRDLSNLGGQENLSGSIIKQIAILLPSIPEQQKIASFLDLIDGRISTQNKIIKELELLIKSISQIIFHGHRYKFKKASLGSICTIKKGEQINSSVLSESGLYAVMNGGITPSGYYSQYNCVGNTISISEGGNSCGYVQFNDKKFWSGGHCYTLSEINAEISNKYLYYFMKFSENLIMSLRVGSGLPNIQKKDLEKFNVAFPEINQQYQISKFLDLLTEKIQVEKSLKTSLIRQKQYVLKKMFI
ncbi:restriction endonuclease subunit S [Cytophaga hutchinsonii]|uniref:restriction endonuclease subunit S n=1 Tax=Cytophaga hutchinsonii TaxID=985 RepID=UPI00091BC396|nr:restriction endonuclease subunit S [Cytophaga hutchinsonii]SFX89410.1 type I restriction enzyme, S subunit [Cytophaga hutchinsonii ATCC 33406]